MEDHPLIPRRRRYRDPCFVRTPPHNHLLASARLASDLNLDARTFGNRGTYTLTGYFALTLTGSQEAPIVIKGAGAGLTVINQQSTVQNIVNIVGQYFSFYNMSFTGGSRGVRLGPGT
jgi:hypothetical protein